MTPRRIEAFLYFAEIRQREETAQRFRLDALAARGDPKEVDRTLNELNAEPEA